jgi:MscS family membrane protein
MREFLDLLWGQNTIREWLLAAALGTGGFIGGKLCSLILTVFLKRVCYKTRRPLDELIVLALMRPLSILVFLGGLFLGTALLRLGEPAARWVNRILGSLFTGVLAWGLVRMIDRLILHYVPAKGLGGEGEGETPLQPVLRRVLKTLVWLAAAALILRTLGYNVSALMAGLGLGGAAVALASKDTLANFFGSITVFVDRPFRLNDRIKILGYDGVITDMGIRTSRLRTMENRMVIIPNSVFAANPIENVSAEPYTRVNQTLPVKRENGLEKIRQGLSILIEACSTQEGTCGLPSAGITAAAGGVCQVNFTYYVSKQADYLGTVNRVNLDILRRFEESGILLG